MYAVMTNMRADDSSERWDAPGNVRDGRNEIENPSASCLAVIGLRGGTHRNSEQDCTGNDGTKEE